MCVCVDCACPTGDWPPCDRPVLTEPARVPLLARCRTGAAAAGHLHSHALLPWDALVLPRRLDMLVNYLTLLPHLDLDPTRILPPIPLRVLPD